MPMVSYEQAYFCLVQWDTKVACFAFNSDTKAAC